MTVVRNSAPPARTGVNRYFNSGTSVNQNEYTTYLGEACVDFNDLGESIAFWGRNKERYPALARMAADFLAIPASSAPVERLFSISGHIYTKKRNRTTPETLEIQCLLNYWHRNKI